MAWRWATTAGDERWWAADQHIGALNIRVGGGSWRCGRLVAVWGGGVGGIGGGGGMRSCSGASKEDGGDRWKEEGCKRRWRRR